MADATSEQFDAVAHIKAANEAESAIRAGKEAPKPEATKDPAVVPERAPEGEQPHLPRSVRREINRLREEAGELRGRLKAYEELGINRPAAAKAAEATKEDPEPLRKDFGTDADFNRALGRWDARQEVSKAEAKAATKEGQKAEIDALRAEVEASEAKAQTDIKTLFPDWEAVSKAAADDPEAPEFVPAEHPVLMTLLARSDVKAHLLYHFAKEPAVLEKLLAMTGKDQNKQIVAFHRLEGAVERLYAKAPEKKAEKASETAAERDARKPRPSESVVVRGGTATDGAPSMLLADGKTINPAWKAARNAAAGLRP